MLPRFGRGGLGRSEPPINQAVRTDRCSDRIATDRRRTCRRAAERVVEAGLRRVGLESGNAKRIRKLTASEGIYGLVVMAPTSVLPSGGTPVSLLERDVQVAALQGLIEAARGGGGRFAVIEGSAGIGKTRLLTEARAMAGSAGMRVLAARGGEFEG